LKDCPAHTRDAAVKSELGTSYEITLALNGTVVLYDYMKPGDVIDLLQSIEAHLSA